MLFYVGSFSYTPHAMLHVEFLSHAPCYFMWGVSLTHSMRLYVGSFSYTPHAMLYGEFLLHAQCYFMLGVSLTHPMLCYLGSFSYMPLCYVGSFPYTPNAILCAEFLLYAPCYFMWGALINSLVCWSYLCWICAVCRCRRRECLSSGWTSARWSGQTEDLDSKTYAIHANHFSTLLYSLSFITKGCFWVILRYCKQESKPFQYTFIQSQFYYKGLLLRVYIL